MSYIGTKGIKINSPVCGFDLFKNIINKKFKYLVIDYLWRRVKTNFRNNQAQFSIE